MTLSAGNRNKQDDTHLPGVRASAFRANSQSQQAFKLQNS